MANNVVFFFLFSIFFCNVVSLPSYPFTSVCNDKNLKLAFLFKYYCFKPIERMDILYDIEYRSTNYILNTVSYVKSDNTSAFTLYNNTFPSFSNISFTLLDFDSSCNFFSKTNCLTKLCSDVNYKSFNFISGVFCISVIDEYVLSQFTSNGIFNYYDYVYGRTFSLPTSILSFSIPTFINVKDSSGSKVFSLSTDYYIHKYFESLNHIHYIRKPVYYACADFSGVFKNINVFHRSLGCFFVMNYRNVSVCQASFVENPCPFIHLKHYNELKNFSYPVYPSVKLLKSVSEDIFIDDDEDCSKYYKIVSDTLLLMEKSMQSGEFVLNFREFLLNFKHFNTNLFNKLFDINNNLHNSSITLDSMVSRVLKFLNSTPCFDELSLVKVVKGFDMFLSSDLIKNGKISVNSFNSFSKNMSFYLKNFDDKFSYFNITGIEHFLGDFVLKINSSSTSTMITYDFNETVLLLDTVMHHFFYLMTGDNVFHPPVVPVRPRVRRSITSWFTGVIASIVKPFFDTFLEIVEPFLELIIDFFLDIEKLVEKLITRLEPRIIQIVESFEKLCLLVLNIFLSLLHSLNKSLHLLEFALIYFVIYFKFRDHYISGFLLCIVIYFVGFNRLVPSFLPHLQPHVSSFRNALKTFDFTLNNLTTSYYYNGSNITLKTFYGTSNLPYFNFSYDNIYNFTLEHLTNQIKILQDQLIKFNSTLKGV